MVVRLHHGTGWPVFWIPGGGGLSVLSYRDIAQRLGDRSVYGIEAPVGGAQAPDVAELARDYVRAIRSADPLGPHAIFGFSAGAFVAYEVALTLWSSGSPPWLVVLFDAALPVRRGPWDAARALVRQARYHVRRLADLPLDRIEPELRGTAAVVKKKFRERMDGDLGAAGARRGGAFDRRDRHNRALVSAYARGGLRRYPGELTLVLAENTSLASLGEDLDPRLAWSALASRVRVHRVPGSHLSMLRPPVADLLAETLRRCLLEVPAEGPGAPESIGRGASARGGQSVSR
jgi:thioesterase domain-containing protein